MKLSGIGRRPDRENRFLKTAVPQAHRRISEPWREKSAGELSSIFFDSIDCRTVCLCRIKFVLIGGCNEPFEMKAWRRFGRNNNKDCSALGAGFATTLDARRNQILICLSIEL